MLGAIKQAARDFLTWHSVAPVRRLQMELIYQGIFERHCRVHGIEGPFYPLGAAACYGLMYLLARTFAEHRIESVLEFGSGQSSLLISRLATIDTRHACYEEDAAWHTHLSDRLARTDYRLRPLQKTDINGVSVDWYAGVEPMDFDLMLVDGPRGTPQYSRYGCLQAIAENTAESFVVIVDDAERPGEAQTVAAINTLLRARGVAARTAYLEARTTQAVIATGRFQPVTHYF